MQATTDIYLHEVLFNVISNCKFEVVQQEDGHSCRDKHEDDFHAKVHR